MKKIFIFILLGVFHSSFAQAQTVDTGKKVAGRAYGTAGTPAIIRARIEGVSWPYLITDTASCSFDTNDNSLLRHALAITQSNYRNPYGRNYTNNVNRIIRIGSNYNRTYMNKNKDYTKGRTNWGACNSMTDQQFQKAFYPTQTRLPPSGTFVKWDESFKKIGNKTYYSGYFVTKTKYCTLDDTAFEEATDWQQKIARRNYKYPTLTLSNDFKNGREYVGSCNGRPEIWNELAGKNAEKYIRQLSSNFPDGIYKLTENSNTFFAVKNGFAAELSIQQKDIVDYISQIMKTDVSNAIVTSGNRLFLSGRVIVGGDLDMDRLVLVKLLFTDDDQPTPNVDGLYRIGKNNTAYWAVYGQNYCAINDSDSDQVKQTAEILAHTTNIQIVDNNDFTKGLNNKQWCKNSQIKVPDGVYDTPALKSSEGVYVALGEKYCYISTKNDQYTLSQATILFNTAKVATATAPVWQVARTTVVPPMSPPSISSACRGYALFDDAVPQAKGVFTDKGNTYVVYGDEYCQAEPSSSNLGELRMLVGAAQTGSVAVPDFKDAANGLFIKKYGLCSTFLDHVLAKKIGGT